ncbi:MAG: LLM class flavin-dependent oxidoreductase [Alphaproteobacteria bacterium]|jgi:alkanesulfonate monooxygenase SsuD/methylene tetrahydromethanopterin reductase-like flavin-dependent oxidoreductase (luciferase family)|nr:LLM class flavin-dependent oxidoreductase [Alphaproteobacteria bacterium]MDP6814278.1 LLM class flavin-dependent oxidoreductase [Alphaproteobacteria bacterium]
MELGLFTMPLHPPGANFTETLKADLAQIIALDELGYAEAWIGEHFTAEWENIPSPELFIAQAIALTRQIRLGTGVSCMPNHNPFVLASRIAQLDHMAEGRFNWGIGTGSFPGDMQVFGYWGERPAVDNAAYSRASLDTILQLWADPKPGVYESDWWRFTIPETDDDIGLRAHIRPYQQPHPPIGVAGVSPNSPTLKMAGRRGWIPMSINLIPPKLLKTHWDAIEEGAREEGRTADRAKWRVAREVFVAESGAEARRQVATGVMARDFEQYFLRLLPKVGRLDMMKTDPGMADSDVTIDYLIDNLFIVGSVDEVAQKLNDLKGEIGDFGTLLAMGHEWEPYGAWHQSMSLLKNEVLPRVA